MKPGADLQRDRDAAQAELHQTLDGIRESLSPSLLSREAQALFKAGTASAMTTLAREAKVHPLSATLIGVTLATMVARVTGGWGTRLEPSGKSPSAGEGAASRSTYAAARVTTATPSRAYVDAAHEPRPGSWPGLWAAARRAAGQWSEHRSAKTGAALAYYSIFSLGPLIVVVIAVASLVFERSAVQSEVIAAIRGLLGDKGSEAVNTMLASSGKTGEGIFASIIGTVTLVFAALGVVVQLKDALNTAWGVVETPGKGFWGFARTYVFSLAAVLATGFLLLISMLVSAGLAALGGYVGTFMPEPLLHAATVLVSFAVISLLFILMFRFLPDAEVRWGDVWRGGLLTAALFEVGRFAIGYYIGRQGLESTYGASASIVILLIWVYYSAQIVLFGAEFTSARATARLPAQSRYR